MNERIENILASVDIDLYTDEGVLMTSVLVSPKDLRKFAEQVVRECAHLVGGYTKENEFGTDVKEAYEEITKHFGVEE